MITIYNIKIIYLIFTPFEIISHINMLLLIVYNLIYLENFHIKKSKHQKLKLPHVSEDHRIVVPSGHSGSLYPKTKLLISGLKPLTIKVPAVAEDFIVSKTFFCTSSRKKKVELPVALKSYQVVVSVISTLISCEFLLVRIFSKITSLFFFPLITPQVTYVLLTLQSICEGHTPFQP